MVLYDGYVKGFSSLFQMNAALVVFATVVVAVLVRHAELDGEDEEVRVDVGRPVQVGNLEMGVMGSEKYDDGVISDTERASPAPLPVKSGEEEPVPREGTSDEMRQGLT